MENLYDSPPNTIRTNSGLYVNVFEPKEDMFCIEDIAHALSNNQRWSGHLEHYFSVANHCINCSSCGISNQECFDLLMHDCSEAYLMDIATPIKSGLSNYKKIEHNLMLVLSKKFRFNYPFYNFIKCIDIEMLEFEWEYLMVKKANPNKSFKETKEEFLKLYHQFKP